MEDLSSNFAVKDILLNSVMEALVVEISISVTKSWAFLLLMMGSSPSDITIELPREPRQFERLSKADLYVEKQPDPQAKDASETEDDDEDKDDGKDDEDDDGGEDEEEFSGEEEDDVDPEDEPEANGDRGSKDEDDDDDDEEDDDDAEDGEEEEDEEEDEESPQPPAKKRK